MQYLLVIDFFPNVFAMIASWQCISSLTTPELRIVVFAVFFPPEIPSGPVPASSQIKLLTVSDDRLAKGDT